MGKYPVAQAPHDGHQYNWGPLLNAVGGVHFDAGTIDEPQPYIRLGPAECFSHQQTNGFHEQATGTLCPLIATILARAPRIKICAICRRHPATTYRSLVTGLHETKWFLEHCEMHSRIHKLLCPRNSFGRQSWQRLDDGTCPLRGVWSQQYGRNNTRSIGRRSSRRRSRFGVALLPGTSVQLPFFEVVVALPDKPFLRGSKSLGPSPESCVPHGQPLVGHRGAAPGS